MWSDRHCHQLIVLTALDLSHCKVCSPFTVDSHTEPAPNWFPGSQYISVKVNDVRVIQLQFCVLSKPSLSEAEEAGLGWLNFKRVESSSLLFRDDRSRFASAIAGSISQLSLLFIFLQMHFSFLLRNIWWGMLSVRGGYMCWHRQMLAKLQAPWIHEPTCGGAGWLCYGAVKMS